MPSAPSFLDLPENIRLKIYGYSGLIRFCPIELTLPDAYDPRHHDGSGRRPLSPGDPRRSFNDQCLYVKFQSGFHRGGRFNEPDCVCPRLPTQLLYVSRALYEDSFSVLYSRNRFILRYRQPDDLDLALKLNSHILSTINTLLVRLNFWPCVRGHHQFGRSPRALVIYAPPLPPPPPPLPPQPPLVHLLVCRDCSSPTPNTHYAMSSRYSDGKHLLAQWKRLSTHLASTITAGKLKFTFICDVADLLSGQSVLEPLSILPSLKQCTIRLSGRLNYELSFLARDASIQTTRSFVRPTRTFPFERLPRELRLHILGYTHLGRHDGYIKGDEVFHIKEGKRVRGHTQYSYADDKCCKKCTDAMDCCCSSTYATYSTTCICRQLPMALFLVNKEMYRDAITVLLQQNCFDFEQDIEKTINFLARFPPGSLKHVRQIQFRFTEKQTLQWGPQGNSQKWLALAKFLRDHFKVLQLSIIVVAHTYDLGSYPYEDYDIVQHQIYDIYCDITRSLRTLGGVANIRFCLGWFQQLGPFMSRAVVGDGHEATYPELDIPAGGEMQLGILAPSWFKKADFTGDTKSPMSHETNIGA